MHAKWRSWGHLDSNFGVLGVMLPPSGRFWGPCCFQVAASGGHVGSIFTELCDISGICEKTYKNCNFLNVFWWVGTWQAGTICWHHAMAMFIGSRVHKSYSGPNSQISERGLCFNAFFDCFLLFLFVSWTILGCQGGCASIQLDRAPNFLLGRPCQQSPGSDYSERPPTEPNPTSFNFFLAGIVPTLIRIAPAGSLR